MCKNEFTFLLFTIRIKMSEYPILYNINQTGKTQFWKIYIKNNLIYRESWYENGKLREYPPIECTIKNKNKSNETTMNEQVKLECQSKWTAQFKKGYKIYNENNSDNQIQPSSANEKPQLLLPMLAQKFTERKKYIQLPCGVSRKLDGVRMIATLQQNDKVQLTSRTSKEFYWMNIIRSHLYMIFKQFPNIILDGEIYSHTLPFSTLCGAIRTLKSPSTYDDILEYWIFDIADDKIPYKERIDKLKKIKTWYESQLDTTTYCSIRFEFYEEIDNLSVVQEYHDKYVNEGYEGLIIRNLKGMYKFQYRTNDLQKYKNFEDSEFKIVGFKAGQGTEKGAIIYICEVVPGGLTFDVRPRGSIEDRVEKYKCGNDFIGKNLIVRYQQAIKAEDQAKDEMPRFPVGIEIRDYE